MFTGEIRKKSRLNSQIVIAKSENGNKLNFISTRLNDFRMAILQTRERI